MFFRSIRFKALVWYVIFLTVTLSIFSLILYKSFNNALYHNLDDLLVMRAEGVTSSMLIYWTMSQDGNTIGVKPDAESIKDFTAVAHEWVEERNKDSDPMGLFVRIVDAKGSTILASRTIFRIGQLDKEDLENVIGGEESFDIVKGEPLVGNQASFRMYSKPVKMYGKVHYIVQVAGPTNLVSIALNNLRFALFILVPLTIVLAAIPGILLAGLTLHPVDSMVNTLRRITVENLNLRLHLPDTKDEIKRLADTFNEMLDRLDRSFSSQNRFIQDISKELKVPVQEMKEELEASVEKDATKDEQKLLLKKAARVLGFYSDTMDNFIALSRMDDAQTPLELRKVNIGKRLEAIVKSMRKQASEKGIDISFSCDGEIVIDADMNYMKQLFTNIIDNAIKATYRGGKISVSAAPDGGYARITVSDTGIGIPKDELPYIFDKFYQVKRSRSVAKGFGLGLSIARFIAEEHKGSIAVESEEGKGSTFTVFLPIFYPG